jgi:1,2-diacylglycerol 3-alpha-glucosyltransferase
MRIVIAGQTYFPAANGQAMFTTRLAEGLARAGHQVLVIVPSEHFSAYSVERNGVRLEALTAVSLGAAYPDAYFTGFPYLAVRRLFNSFRPDLVHIQDHYPLSRVVLDTARRRHLPVMGTNHFLPQNIIHYVNKFAFTRPAMERLLWWTMLEPFNRLDAVTTPTQTAADILHQQGIRPPVMPISCGVDLGHFRKLTGEGSEAVRAKYGLAVDKRLIIYVGRIDKEKRLDVLLRAVANLPADDWQLALVGSGRNVSVYTELAESLGLLSSGKAIFTGRVPGEDLPDLLNGAEVFAMPSEAELQSIATLEAMACGLPVIAANARALPELIEDGINGLLFEPGSPEAAAGALQRLLASPQLRAEMGLASQAKARKHGLGQTLLQYQEIYFQLEAAKRRVPRRVYETAGG